MPRVGLALTSDRLFRAWVVCRIPMIYSCYFQPLNLQEWSVLLSQNRVAVSKNDEFTVRQLLSSVFAVSAIVRWIRNVAVKLNILSQEWCYGDISTRRSRGHRSVMCACGNVIVTLDAKVLITSFPRKPVNWTTVPRKPDLKTSFPTLTDITSNETWIEVN